MRMLPNRTLIGKPLTIKKEAISRLKHLGAPLKGLALGTKLTPGDAQTATILRNFVIEDDRILSRAGTQLRATLPASPVHHLIPYHGDIPRIAAAAGANLYDADTGALLKAGFTAFDYDWTSFSNLGESKYTVFVNGADGVWSWDGGAVAASAVAIVSLSNANPAVVTVAAADINKFTSGSTVLVAGADATHAAANGYHLVGIVNTTANTFTLLDVDLSGAAGAQGPSAGFTVTAQGSIAREAVTAPADATWAVPAQFQLVLAHQNRLWFADSTNLAVFYLPTQQKSGELEGLLPLNAVFKRGGSIRAMFTWTLEGGTSMNDQLVIFTTNGEAAIYAGIDPLTDMQLVGVYRFDTPMSKHSVVNYGGELYVLIPTGVVPMSTMLRAETENLGQVDRNVISLFLREATQSLARDGWQLFLNPSSGRLIANMPTGTAKQYRQMVRHMPRPVWSEWRDLGARCWGWISPYLYVGDDDGKVYRMHPSFLNDAGRPILCDVQLAWSTFGTPASKQFKMIKPYLITDGDPKPLVEIMLDYKFGDPSNEPDITTGLPGAVWDEATWDVDYWAADENRVVASWNGVKGRGGVGAPRLQVQLSNCQLAVAAFDVLYEEGGVVG